MAQNQIPSPHVDAKIDTKHVEMSEDIDTDTKQPNVIEGLDTQGTFESIKPKPDSIANLSEDELASIEKKMIRKMDLVILPLVGFLYILNCE